MTRFHISGDLAALTGMNPGEYDVGSDGLLRYRERQWHPWSIPVDPSPIRCTCGDCKPPLIGTTT